MELLEMINKTSRINKTTRDVTTTVNTHDVLRDDKDAQADACQLFEQEQTGTCVDDKTAREACDAVVDEVIETESQTRELTDVQVDVENIIPNVPKCIADIAEQDGIEIELQTRALKNAQMEVESVMPKCIADRTEQDVTRDQAGEIVNCIDAKVFKEAESEISISEAVEKNSEEIVNRVLGSVVRELESRTSNLDFNAIDGRESMDTAKDNDVVHTIATGNSMDFPDATVDLNFNSSRKISVKWTESAYPDICTRCGSVRRSLVPEGIVSNYAMEGNGNKTPHTAEQFMTGDIVNTPASTTGEPACPNEVLLQFFKPVNGRSEGSKTSDMSNILPQLPMEKQTHAPDEMDRANEERNYCLIGKEVRTSCRISTSDASAQTRIDDQAPFRSEGKLRSFICCRR